MLSFEGYPLSLERGFSFLEAFMRLALVFLSQDMPLRQTLESTVRCGRSVAFVSKCCSLTDTQHFWKVYLASKRLSREMQMCFYRKRITFLKQLKASMDVSGVLRLFLEWSRLQDTHFLCKGYLAS